MGDGPEGNAVALRVSRAFNSFSERLAKGLPAFYVKCRLISAYKKPQEGQASARTGAGLRARCLRSRAYAVPVQHWATCVLLARACAGGVRRGQWL